LSPSLQKTLPRLFGALLLALLALAAWQWRDGPPVQASMLALLPKGAGDALEGGEQGLGGGGVSGHGAFLGVRGRL
jgi:hypothetical protein